MAFIPASDVIQVVFRWTTASGFCGSNTLFYDNGGPVSAGALEDLGNGIAALLGDVAIDKPWSSAVHVDNLLLRDMTSEASFVLDYGVGIASAGDAVEAYQPGNVTIALALKTGLAGPSRRGRIFLVGLTEGQVTGNRLVAGAASDIEAYWETFLTPVVGEPTHLIVASFYTAAGPRVTAQKTPVTGVSLTDIRVDTQKRRLKLPGLV